MANRSTPVAVMDTAGGVNILKIEYIANENIPESLNGESGFHVCHVRMLTELILKQFVKSDSGVQLSDEEISAIAIASSLHDIGKMKIPKSIWDFPGKLSPIEYDIVKRHSVLGEEIISETPAEIDPLIVKYAKEIARSHHERYDGSGYPDGLKGDAIPLAAQAVSLADAFDALTSARSYKQAFSQDVAIDMISNGMCGIFDPALIECLLRVVNNKVLVDIRERFTKSRSVVSNPNVFVPKKVLFIGNTGYVTETLLEETFPHSKVTIIGDSHLDSDKNHKVYNIKKPPIKDIFDTYDFDIIVYFANELTYDSSLSSDAEKLRETLKYAKETQKEAKFLYLSSLDAAFADRSDRAILAAAKENLCEHCRKESSLDIKIVRIPYLYLGTKKDDYLYSVFEQIYSGRTVVFHEKSVSRCYFLSGYDLSELLSRIIDGWKSGTGVLNINDEFDISFSDFAKKLGTLESGVKVDFTETNPPKILKANNVAVRNEYGWFSKISILEDLYDEYEEYLLSKAPKGATLWERFKEWLARHAFVIKIIELFVLFVLTEILLHITGSAVFFSIVDFRMAYIVIMGTIHGLTYGIAAAGLSSVSWLVAKIFSGTKWLTIFYEPTNWLAFVFFFLVGGICGYVRRKNDDKIKFLKERNELLEEKLIFTRELYKDTFQEKRELKKQIIGSKDSFGKIFDITRKLDTVEPRKLYLKIMDTFEDVLENKSISVYSVNENSAFGRLEVASRDIINDVARSVSMETYAKIAEEIAGGEIWRNTDLASGLPMYAAGVYRGGKMELLILIWHADLDQRSLYYVNLFKILRDLVQMSLLRAYDYNQAVYEKQFISGTRILNAEAFGSELENFKKMADRKVFSYVLLEIDYKDHSYSEVDEMVSRRIRTNDVLGVMNNGKVGLLLSQATHNDLSFILPRFEDLDIEITVLRNGD